MNIKNRIIVLSVVALFIGLVFGLPLLQFNLNHEKNSFERPLITIDVTYVYVQKEQYYKGSTLSTALVNSIFIVNITNPSNISLFINEVNVYAANYINTISNKTTYSQVIKGIYLSQKLAFNEPLGIDTWDSLPVLGPYSSKLMALSGNTEVKNITALYSKTVYLGASIQCSVDDWHSTWGESKQVEMSDINNVLLYNNNLSNKTVHINGNSAYLD